MEDCIIKEDYTLPSKGKVYSRPVSQDFTIRSMTTAEEMKRLGKSELPNKMLSEIIDDCLVRSPGISSYDMCVGDYQYLLYKLRIVTYGPDYKIVTHCPFCGATNKQTLNLDQLKVSEYSEDYTNLLNIKLPRTGKQVKLRLQTPRILDEIFAKTKKYAKEYPDAKGDPAVLFNLESVIEQVDGELLNPVQLEAFVRSLPMQDSNYILQTLRKIDIGIDMNINCTCDNCGTDYGTALPFSGEFFGPSID